jgi:hypothetical protein
MRSSRLLALFVVGGWCSLAAAQPATESLPKKEETSGRVTLRDTEKGARPPRSPGGWIEIASPTPAKHGTEFIVVGGEDAGMFSQLRIDAAKGRTAVRQVRVWFADGTRKTFPVGRTISDKGRKYTIVDLGTPKAIDQVVIKTDDLGRGEYAIYGSSGASGGGEVSSR